MKKTLFSLFGAMCVCLFSYAGNEGEDPATVTKLPLIVDMSDGLPGELSEIPNSTNWFVMDHKYRTTWESPLYNLEEAVNGVRLTVFDTRINESHNDFPMIAIGELEFYDADGNLIEYSANNVTTNSLETTEGSLFHLNDGNVETFYHSIWSSYTYPKPESHVYLDVDFEQEITSLKVVYTSRDYRHSPTIMAISKIGEKVEHPLWGYSGPGSIWRFDKETGVLSIEGEGSVRGGYGDTYLTMHAPWNFFADEIKDVTFSDGIDNINLKLFGGTDWYRNVYKHWYESQDDGFVCYNNVLVGFKGVFEGGDVEIPEGVRGIACGALKNWYSISSLVLPTTLTSIEDSAFYNSYIEIVVMQDGLKRIGAAAFENCRGLKNAVIPGSVEKIGAKAFFASAANWVEIREGVKEISDYAFANNWYLFDVSLPKTLTTIADAAFHNAQNLTSVVIPENVDSIGDRVFWNCPNLKTYYVMNTTPVEFYYTTFHTYSATLYVPVGTKEAYEASGWGLFENIVETDYTGIKELEVDGVKEVFYDLNGRVVEKPVKGVYIRNGKKFIY